MIQPSAQLDQIQLNINKYSTSKQMWFCFHRNYGCGILMQLLKRPFSNEGKQEKDKLLSFPARMLLTARYVLN